MERKTGRRAVLRMLGATPVGLAGGLALAEGAVGTNVLAAVPTVPRWLSVTGMATGPVEPDAESWKTSLIGSASDLRLPAPPDSAAEVEQVRAMAGRLSQGPGAK